MHRKTCLLGAVVAASTLALAGCSSDEDGNPGTGTDGGAGTGGSVDDPGAGGRDGKGGERANVGGGTGGRAVPGDGGSSSGTGGSGNGTGGSGTAGTCASGTCGSGGTPGQPGTIGSCKVFSADDAWNLDVYEAPVDTAWTDRLLRMVGDVDLHPDYGNAGDEHYGIPINVVPEGQAMVDVNFDWYPEESDPAPYPFPDPGAVKIEGGTPDACDGDCHLLVVQEGTCQLFEGYACSYESGWHCGNGARWDLTRNSYGQRPKGWTSADAAGLAIMPGLVRVDEVRSGEMRHAIRFTTRCTRANYVAPATHLAVPDGCEPDAADSPPMGLRVRLKASYDVTALGESAAVVARAMQHYGMILADNGSNFYFQGEDDPRWTEDDVEPLKRIPAGAFEVIAPPPLEE